MGIITTADHLYRALDLAAWPTRLPASHTPGTPTPACGRSLSRRWGREGTGRETRHSSTAWCCANRCAGAMCS